MGGFILRMKSTLNLKSNESMLLKERQVTVRKDGLTIRMVFTLDEVFDRDKWETIKIEYEKGD